MIWVRHIVMTILLINITYTDMRRQEIDNEPLFIALIFIVLFSLCGFNNVSVVDSLIGFLLAGCLFLAISLTGGMGGGDIKLIAVLGYFVGWKLVLLIMQSAFMFGGLFAIALIFFSKSKSVKDAIAFGPAIAFATIFVLLFENAIWQYLGF